MSTIHFVGGEKGGVGKSVFARLLAQYFIDRQMPFTALDADVSNASLLRVYSDYCRPVDLAHLESADDIFTLASEMPGRQVLVDLPAQSERPLAVWMDNGGIAELVAEMQIRLVYWHVMDDSKDAVVALSRLLARHGDSVRYCVVKNAGRGKDFSLFDHSPVRAEAERLHAHILELPELHGPVMRKIDRFDTSYWAAINNSTHGEVFTRLERQRVKVWQWRVFKQLSSLPLWGQDGL
jgi:hypothetical protein